MANLVFLPIEAEIGSGAYLLGELLKDDQRWIYGTPPAGNANSAWRIAA
jgi:hypothetical protein